MKQITEGSRVRILSDIAKGRCWEFGHVADIRDGKALIRYPECCMGIVKPLDQLELVKENNMGI